MAVTCDLRDDPNGWVEIFCSSFKTILRSSDHPRYKRDVGYRLSRSGLAVAYGQQVEFQGPIVENVSYSSGGQIVNITYTAVSSIELRNPNGFEVYTLLFLIFKEFYAFIFRFVAKEVIVRMMLYGFHPLYQIKVA